MSGRKLQGREDRYIIEVDYSAGRSGRFYKKWILHLDDLNVEASFSPLIWHTHQGHGFGFQVGRNGSESDLGLDLHAGRLGSVWMRLRSPWTKWANIADQTKPNWYEPRHTGIRFRPWSGCLVRWEIDQTAHSSRSSDPWWREQSITRNTFFGRQRTETSTGDPVAVAVPLPEGVYAATATKTDYATHYVGRLGKLRDRLLGPRRHSSWQLDIPGGIPVEGKGENSYDCGMDGLFGCDGKSPEDAVANAVRFVLRDRNRYGGPHNLPRPMTVAEAEANRGAS